MPSALLDALKYLLLSELAKLRPVRDVMEDAGCTGAMLLHCPVQCVTRDVTSARGNCICYFKKTGIYVNIKKTFGGNIAHIPVLQDCLATSGCFADTYWPWSINESSRSQWSTSFSFSLVLLAKQTINIQNQGVMP